VSWVCRSDRRALRELKKLGYTEQQAKDDAECRAWATQQTGFSPGYGAPQPVATPGRSQDCAGIFAVHPRCDRIPYSPSRVRR
jgi:hypothetical protein